MGRRRHTAEQIITALREAEGRLYNTVRPHSAYGGLPRPRRRSNHHPGSSGCLGSRDRRWLKV